MWTQWDEILWHFVIAWSLTLLLPSFSVPVSDDDTSSASNTASQSEGVSGEDRTIDESIHTEEDFSYGDIISDGSQVVYQCSVIKDI